MFALGTIVTTKKNHPCGGNTWEIVRVGADYKIRCLQCGRVVMLPRQDFERAAKKKLEKEEGQ